MDYLESYYKDANGDVKKNEWSNCWQREKEK